MTEINEYIDIVFDGPAGAESGRFVEVENEAGDSINAGEWVPPRTEGTGFWRLRIHAGRGINSIAKAMHQIARDSGFYDEGRVKTPLEEVCLWVTECAEAAEETRTGLPLDQVYYRIKKPMDATNRVWDLLRKIEISQDGVSPIEQRNPLSPAEWRELVEAGIAKPEGYAIEAADVVIRIMDSLEAKGISLADMIDLKAAYNRTRPYMHGKTK